MHIATSGTSQNATNGDIKSALERLHRDLKGKADLIVAFYEENENTSAIFEECHTLFPTAQILGCSSCLGAMTNEGLFSGTSFWAISDPEGSYGVGIAPKSEDYEQATNDAIDKALAEAGRDGEIPDLIWLHASPGDEETVIQTIINNFGSETPIAGGSCADNNVQGNWHISDSTVSLQEGVAVAVMFPSTPLRYAFHSGYSPTPIKGTVTRSEGRKILEIDHKPAALIYNDWVEKELEDEVINGGGTILSKTTLHPLGIEVPTPSHIDTVKYYNLAHPETITNEGELTLFSKIPTGTNITLMSGSVDTLTQRAGRVAQDAIDSTTTSNKSIAGGLVIYCAGCMLTVRERMPEVISSLNTAFNGKPFTGAFTFGEQGRFIGGENRHGNLMISVVVFENG